MRRTKDRLRPYVLAGRRLRRDRPSVVDLAWAQPRSFSQFGEDRFLLRYFDGQASGFYVDVGAFHPFHASNTYLLYKRGWRGINIEPSPDGFAVLQHYRPRDVTLPIAIASVEGKAQFSLAGSFAGIDGEQHLWREMPAERITVETQTLACVIADHLLPGHAIDLLDVDCEGHDLVVLRSNNWERYRPQLVLAEAHSETAGKQITQFLEATGYSLYTRLDLTLIFEDSQIAKHAS